MALSPTGIKTEPFIWLRGVQFLFSLVIFCAGAIEQSRWGVVVGLFVPVMVFSLLLLLDSVIFYKHRYAAGAGRVSTLRWVADLAMILILTTIIPVLGVTHRNFRYSVEGRGPYSVPVALMVVELILTGLDLILFLATFIMLCVEDVRLRKRNRASPPSATEPMPTAEEPLTESVPNYGTVDADRASTIMNSILATGVTVQQLERMAAAPSQTPADATKREAGTRPPTYVA